MDNNIITEKRHAKVGETVVRVFVSDFSDIPFEGKENIIGQVYKVIEVHEEYGYVIVEHPHDESVLMLLSNEYEVVVNNIENNS